MKGKKNRKRKKKIGEMERKFGGKTEEKRDQKKEGKKRGKRGTTHSTLRIGSSALPV